MQMSTYNVSSGSACKANHLWSLISIISVRWLWLVISCQPPHWFCFLKVAGKVANGNQGDATTTVNVMLATSTWTAIPWPLKRCNSCKCEDWLQISFIECHCNYKCCWNRWLVRKDYLFSLLEWIKIGWVYRTHFPGARHPASPD